MPMYIDQPSLLGTLPTTTFGVEMEFASSRATFNQYASGIRQNMARYGGVEQFAPIHIEAESTADRWVIKADGSCGGECTSPALTWAQAWHLDVAAGGLWRAGARTDARCGVHVHHALPGLSDQELRCLWLLWAALEPSIQVLLPPHRWQNTYSRTIRPTRLQTHPPSAGYVREPLPWGEFAQPLRTARLWRGRLERSDRYMSLNVSHWWRTGRVEVRSHHGTFRARDIKGWALFTQLFLLAAKEPLRASVRERLANLPLAEQFPNLVSLVTGGNAATPLGQFLQAQLLEWATRRNPAAAAALPRAFA